MSSLVSIYKEFIRKAYDSSIERALLIDVLKQLEEHLLYQRERGCLFIVRAPTGYGKTSLTLSLIYGILAGEVDFLNRVMHVLPLRSIIDDIYESCLTMFENKFNVPYELIKEAIGRQMMYARGARYFQKLGVFTTYDTFTFMLAKIPTSDLKLISERKSLGYFEIPRASVMDSVVIFDEVQLMLCEGCEKARTSLTSILHVLLSRMKVPVVLMGATIPDWLIRELKLLFSKKAAICILDFEPNKDPSFTEERLRKILRTHIIEAEGNSIGTIVTTALENASKDRLLIVLNTIKRARETYLRLRKEMGREEVFLLHSLFKPKDRQRILSSIRDSKRWILVSTQAVEAGVNISAEVLITDAAPAPALIQRTGRVARFKGEIQGEIYIIYDPREGWKNVYTGIYSLQEVKDTISYIRNCEDIAWHIPKGIREGSMGYLDILNSTSEVQYLILDKALNYMISSPVFVSDVIYRILRTAYDGSFLRDEKLIEGYVIESQFMKTIRSHVNIAEYVLGELYEYGEPIPFSTSKMEQVLKKYSEKALVLVKYGGNWRIWKGIPFLERVDRIVFLIDEELYSMEEGVKL